MAEDKPGKVASGKIVQYLSEAYGHEKELEVALTAHIPMTTNATYKKRLQEHLKETKNHAKQLERRIKKLSGSSPSFTTEIPAQAANVAGKVKAAIEGPLDTVRGATGEAEQMLKNAQKEFWNEHKEIAQYASIETLATALGDTETAKLARSIRREEERMAKFLERQVEQLTKAVVREEVPASERRSPAKRRSQPKRRSSGSRRGSAAGSSRKRSSSSSSGSSRKRS